MEWKLNECKCLWEATYEIILQSLRVAEYAVIQPFRSADTDVFATKKF